MCGFDGEGGVCVGRSVVQLATPDDGIASVAAAVLLLLLSLQCDRSTIDISAGSVSLASLTSKCGRSGESSPLLVAERCQHALHTEAAGRRMGEPR